ncbi:alpha/beta hydrolase [Patescibacteria group bacterium]|nr:alpha/beta hydrolase [Patescibacteria group bacterium]
MVLLKTVLIIFIIVIILYLAFSFLVAHLMTTRMSPRIDVTPKLVTENYEEIEFKSTDGLTLKGWWFKTGSEKLVIMIAGLIPNRTNVDYYGMWVAKDMVDAGYDVILYDSRAHGESEGSRNSYGRKEGEDILGAVDFAKEKGFTPENIAIIGDSTGAVSILMIVDQLNGIGALVIDTAATDYKPIIVDRLWIEKKIPPIFAPGIFFFTDTVFGLGIGEVKPIEKIKLVPERKFLFLHGELDETFPVEEAKQLHAAANPQSKLVIFPEGSHIETFKSDPDLYRKEVFDFLSAELGK